MVATGNPNYICYAGVTYEKTGQPTKADAALKSFGNLTLVDCDRFKARKRGAHRNGTFFHHGGNRGCCDVW